MIGRRLGPYEVVAKLGQGGMGEVYKGRDTRLGRDVALKVLPASLAADPEFRERFDREAKSISALDHPNICALYDVGHDGDSHYLVMQYLEGETLGTRLERGALPLDQALKIGIEICQALENAHRLGITHRDLKPGNVMLVRTGAKAVAPNARSGGVQAKLLDFGLAKRGSESDAASSAATELATRASAGQPLTAKGSILGTFEYMSPEQVEGEDADARSDIWAFGCLLYEMVTGRRAFSGKTRASLIGSILKDDAPRASLVTTLSPASLDHVIATCLAKEPDERWQSAADIARELTWIGTASANETALPARPAGALGRERLFWTIALAASVAVTAAAVWWLKPGVAAISEAPLVRTMLPLPAEQPLLVNPYPSVALSLDGKYLAYRGGTPSQIYLRTLDESQARPIAGAEGGFYPFFSPDGSSLGFLAGRTIKRIALGGGAAVPIVDLTTNNLRGASWGDDGYIYYTPTVSAGLWRIPASGGPPEQLTTPDFAKAEKTHRFPFVLPGSHGVLFMVGTARITSFGDARIEALDLKTRARTLLVEGGSYPQYAASGHLLYTQGGNLIAVPFDAARLKLTGSPVTVAEGMFVDTLYGMGNYSVSRDGLFVRVAGGASSAPQRPVVLDRHGVVQQLNVDPSTWSGVRVSPDGKKLVGYLTGATSQLSVVDLVRGGATRVTYEWDNEIPLWSPDSDRIVFTSNRGGGPRNLYWMRADGGEVHRILKSENEQQAYSWSSDKHTIAFVDISPAKGADIYTVSLNDPELKPRVFVSTPNEDTFPTFSPDGQWLAYQSSPAGQPEVFVESFPAGGKRMQVSNGGGSQPIWSRQGGALYYRRGSDVMAVSITTDASGVHLGPLEKLFETPYALWDVMPDGQHLLMRTTTPLPPVTQLDVVVNWFRDLRRKVH